MIELAWNYQAQLAEEASGHCGHGYPKTVKEKKTKNMHMLSATTLSDRNKRTISILDPYMPTGLIMKSSSALKSTLVTEAYAPGRIVSMKRLRES
jgi:hypothetical protein